MSTPESIEWPGRGVAKRLTPRGMSDYQRIGDKTVYKTDCGASLFMDRSAFDSAVIYKARYKGHTTKWHSSPNEAMTALDDMASKTAILNQKGK